MTIDIKFQGDLWQALSNDRVVAASKCKACVIKIIKAVTQTSSKYRKLDIYDKDGTFKKSLTIGVEDVTGNGQENRS